MLPIGYQHTSRGRGGEGGGGRDASCINDLGSDKTYNMAKGFD